MCTHPVFCSRADPSIAGIRQKCPRRLMITRHPGRGLRRRVEDTSGLCIDRRVFGPAGGEMRFLPGGEADEATRADECSAWVLICWSYLGPPAIPSRLWRSLRVDPITFVALCVGRTIWRRGSARAITEMDGRVSRLRRARPGREIVRSRWEEGTASIGRS